MSKNIYVGNLSYGLSEQELTDVFSEFGDVASAKIIVDRETGRSKGYGFVEMGNEDQAQSAVTAMDGRDIDGRSAKVSIAKPRQERPHSGGRNFSHGGGRY